MVPVVLVSIFEMLTNFPICFLFRKLRWQDDATSSGEQQPQPQPDQQPLLNRSLSASDLCVTGELVELHRDGSQLIELRRPKGKHFGFYVARGKVKNVNGTCALAGVYWID